MFEFPIAAIATIIIAFGGFAVGYGSLKRTVDDHEHRIVNTQAELARRMDVESCEARHDDLRELGEIHRRAIRSIENYIRWQLAVSGKTPEEINRILSGNGGIR